MPAGNPGAVVYGTIVAASLLAVESSRRESLPAAAGSVVLGVVILWLAHSYAAALGNRLERPTPWGMRHFLAAARHEARLLEGAVIPLAALLLSAAAGASDHLAVIDALASAIAVLLVLEVAAAVASTPRGGALVGQVGVSLVLGAGILLLKAFVH